MDLVQLKAPTALRTSSVRGQKGFNPRAIKVGDAAEMHDDFVDALADKILDAAVQIADRLTVHEATGHGDNSVVAVPLD